MNRLEEVLGTVLLKARQASTLPLEDLIPQAQPRRRFESLEALAESIREQGVLQPLLVRPLEDGHYAIVAGERRYRAARMAGLTEVPVQVLNVDEHQARRIALVENLQREDLNPYEETLGVLALLSEELGKSLEEVVALLERMRKERRGVAAQNVLGSPEAQKVEETFRALGRLSWESFVTSRLPLLNLPEDLRRALEEGTLPYTAALELKKVGDEKTRQRLLREVQAGLSLRELKARVREALRREQAPGSTGADRPERGSSTPWHREVAGRLARLNLEALPLQRRQAVEAKLRELLALLEAEGGPA